LRPAAAAPVLVAGAGIGGLTLARALLRAGLPVRVLEREPELRPVGAGITVQINAMQVLAGLGLAEAVAAAGMRLAHGELLRSDGRVLKRLPLEEALAEFGQPSIAIHRARLQAVLLEALPADCLETGRGVAGFEDADDAVELRLEDGETLRGCALVGCDGLRSSVRRALLDDGEPRYAGYTTWRGIARGEMTRGFGRSGEMWGRGLRFGFVPIEPGAVYWFAVANQPAGGTDGSQGALARVRRDFAHFASPAPELLAATDPGAVLRTDAYDRPPSDVWGRGRVTLLGDAAHPMTPNLGQGGCQAIEDAGVLADALAGGDDVPGALRRYEAARQPRTAWFVDTSWRLGRLAQWSHPLACGLRDALMALTPRSVFVRQGRTLYRTDALRA